MGLYLLLLGRYAEAINLIWAQFAESPQLDNFQKLQTHAPLRSRLKKTIRRKTIYRELVAPTVAQSNNHAYEEAIKLLRKVRAPMVRLGHADEVDDYLVSLRVEYKRKRNFIKLLDASA